MRVLLGGQEKEKKNPEREWENKRKKKKNFQSHAPQKMKSKALGGTWVPRLHPVPSQSSKASEKT